MYVPNFSVYSIVKITELFSNNKTNDRGFLTVIGNDELEF